MIPDDDKSIDALDDIFEDAAQAEADDPSKVTDADRAWAARQHQIWQARIAQAYRELELPGTTPAVAPIRAKFLAMTRDALLAALVGASDRMGGQLQLAHRSLSDLSDDDLRRLLETLESEPA